MAIDPKEDWAQGRGERWAANLAGMEATLRPIDEPLVAALAIDAPLRIADIGCGGGGTSLEILRRAPKGSIVHGYDLSPALVGLARARIPAGEASIAFHVADMASATPPEAPYDRVVSRFGTMFYAEPGPAFANVARFLAAGGRGRFAFAVWGPPAENPWIGIVREVAAAMVDLPTPEPDAPGPFRYADPAPLVALLEAAGLGEIAIAAWRGDLPVGGGLPVEAAAAFAVESFGPFGELLAAKGGDAIERARRAVGERLRDHVKGGLVQVPAHVHIVTGVRSR
ncbi:MAG: class I SAM-dependent methyltransferase [Deltaproteobacteria bacterium]|nr:class I SAM-dependent methyltransferase [Deltaproteobacteria bacterium]